MKEKRVFEAYSKMSVITKATIWFMICSFLQKGLSFITTPIFTRLMSLEQFGLYNVYTSWLQILLIVATFRLDYSVFNNGMTKYPEDRDGYASSMLGVTTIITTILFALYLIFQKQVNSATELSTVIMCALFVELYVSAAVNFWSLRERYEFRFKAIVAYTLLNTILSSGIGVFAVLIFEDKGTARILASALVHAVGGIAIYYLIFKRGKKFLSTEYTKFAVLFNIPLLPHYFSSYMIEQADRIMIQKLINFDAAALYSVAYTVGGLVRIFNAAITNTLVPLQYRLLEQKDYRSLNRNIINVMVSVVGLVALITLMGPEIVLVLGGEEYAAAWGVIPPVAASVFFSFLYNLLTDVELFFGKNKFATKLSLVGAAVNIGLNWLLIPICGFVAAAYTTLFSYVIFAVGHMLYVDYVLKEQGAQSRINNKALIAMGFTSIIGCVLIGQLYGSRMVRILLGVGILLIAFKKRKVLISILKKKAQN